LWKEIGVARLKALTKIYPESSLLFQKDKKSDMTLKGILGVQWLLGETVGGDGG